MTTKTEADALYVELAKGLDALLVMTAKRLGVQPALLNLEHLSDATGTTVRASVESPGFYTLPPRDELRHRPPPAHVGAAMNMLRNAWRDDGAEGESIHMVCREVDALRAQLAALQAEHTALQGQLQELEEVAADAEAAHDVLDTWEGVPREMEGENGIMFKATLTRRVECLDQIAGGAATLQDQLRNARCAALQEAIDYLRKGKEETLADAAREHLHAAAGGHRIAATTLEGYANGLQTLLERALRGEP